MKFSEQLVAFWLPIVCLMAVMVSVVWWVFCMVSKPKFSKTATVYAFRILLDKKDNGGYCHKIVGFRKYSMKKYNTASAVLVPSMKPLEAQIMDIHLTATKNGLLCSARYFLSSVYSKDRREHWTGADIWKYMKRESGILMIEELENSSADSFEKRFLVGNERICYVFPQTKIIDENGAAHIETATVLFYENAE